MIEKITKTIEYSYYINNWSSRKTQTYDLPLLKGTVEDIFNALAKNGFKHLRGTWIEEGKSVGACVLGQAALNLNVTPMDEFLEDSKIVRYDRVDYSLFETKLRDYTIEGQLSRWHYTRKKWLDGTALKLNPTLADVITHWNDKGSQEWDVDKQEFVENYALPTYEAIVDMARDVLKPYFNKEVYLLEHDFKEKAA